MILFFLSWFLKETKDLGNENQKKKSNLKQGYLLRDSNKVKIEDDYFGSARILSQQIYQDFFSS